METLLAGEQLDWLAQTKFNPPALRNDVVERPRLAQSLIQSIQHNIVTLVSAPAGAGKTTLLAGFAASMPELPLAWLSLDEDDNDPRRFLAALVTSVSRLNLNCGVALKALLSATPHINTEIRRAVGVLINEIVNTLPQTFVLILDDLQYINDEQTYSILDYLIERMPRQMRLVMATRHDPPLNLARLRVRRQIAELRMADLRFNLEETDGLLKTRLGLDLPVHKVLLLEQRTEGWAAGLSLLTTSLETIEDQDSWESFLNQLAQSDGYLFDFLAEEVLQKQPEKVRDFLLQTSLLNELNPALCQAVTGIPNTNFGRFIPPQFVYNFGR
jgi:LuxR family transcriptional regulator, maltose regulon positive regulatory protein